MKIHSYVKCVSSIFFMFLLLTITPLEAKIVIEVEEGDYLAFPIAVLPFKGEKKLPFMSRPSKVIANDLYLSAKFNPHIKYKIPKNIKQGQFDYKYWVKQGIETVIIGEVIDNTDTYSVKFDIFDTIRNTILMTKSWSEIKPHHMRKIGHVISDMIYYKLTGINGVFSTKIAYVNYSKDEKYKYKLEVSDIDGENAKVVFKSKNPIISPAWAPDGTKLAYVSFETGRSNVVLHYLLTGVREVLSSYKGINSAPAFSPDGKSLSMTLSKTGNTEIYIMNLRTKRLQQITKNPAIDTESVWDPSGDKIYFTSSRLGGPQIFSYDIRTTRIKKISRYGTYNAKPQVSSDNYYMAMVHKNRNTRHNIGVMNLRKHDFYVLTDDFLVEAPTFAPNGDMIIYSMVKGKHGILGMIAVDGKKAQKLRFSKGDIRSPAWGPYSTQYIN